MDILNSSIEQLFYNNKKVRERLKELGLKPVKELCNLTRKNLVEKGLENFYIKEITIALECNGLDLKKR